MSKQVNRYLFENATTKTEVIQ